MIGRLALNSALLAATPARALPDWSANYILPYCVPATEFPPNGRYELKGFCKGIIYALVVAGYPHGACMPDDVTMDQAVRAVVRYVSARPDRMHELFALLAYEALHDAWPCKQ
jgi:hypothetical protein